MPATVMQILSPAKINLFLHITGKRPDGYHTLVSLMCPIRLYDTISLRVGGNQQSVSCAHQAVPEDESNLAAKAARLFLKEANLRHQGFDIHIEKQIPVAAGLGGGSSNAAAVLRALNRHYGGRYSPGQLMKMGQSLGADIPFFINCRPALATGIGEKLEPFYRIDPFHVVLIYPGFGVSTAAVYKKLNLGLTKGIKEIKYTGFNKMQGFDVYKHLCNDLESVTKSMHPEIALMKDALLSQGAEGALMSGSGASVFGLFADPDKARHAYLTLSQREKWRVFLTDMIL